VAVAKATGRRALVEKEILDRAAELFAERGYKGTSLQDVADALGMSRTALYYYMSSKEAILERLVENLSRRDAGALEAIGRDRAAGPAQMLRAMAAEIARNASSNPQQSRILVENRHHLPPELAAADMRAERSVLRSLQGVIEDGMRTGEFRAVDARRAALGIIGMCLWTAWWVDPDAPAAVDGLPQQIAHRALASVRAAPSELDRGDAPSLVRSLRDGLDRLERLTVLDGPDRPSA